VVLRRRGARIGALQPATADENTHRRVTCPLSAGSLRSSHVLCQRALFSAAESPPNPSATT
jgi:hypothetical protein